jgi:hypothetical protein
MITFQRASLTAAFLITLGAVPMSRVKAASSVLGSTVCVRAGLTSGAGSGLKYDVYGVKADLGAPGTVEVVCTLFRDNTINTNGLQDLELSVSTTVDPMTMTSGTITCNASSLDRKGVTKMTIQRSTSTLGDSVLDWGSSLNVSSAKGYYALRCTIPNLATIRSVYYLEP